MIEERQPVAVSADSPANIGACRSVTVTSASEVGWWNTSHMLEQIAAASGGPKTSQWGIRFDPDNAAGSCSLIEVEAMDGSVTRILVDAGWNTDYSRS